MVAAPHRFAGRLVMVGFGCIGQGVLPLLLRHIEMPPERLTVVTRSAGAAGIAVINPWQT